MLRNYEKNWGMGIGERRALFPSKEMNLIFLFLFLIQ